MSSSGKKERIPRSLSGLDHYSPRRSLSHTMKLPICACLIACTLAFTVKPGGEVWTREQEDRAGFLREHIKTPPPR